MRSRPTVVFLAAVILLTVKINAQSTIAQVTTFNSGIAINCYYEDAFDNISIGQTFQSLVTTTMTGIVVSIVNVINTGTVDVEIYSCSGPAAWGSLLGTEANVAVNTSGVLSVDVSGLNIAVVASNYYGFRIVPDNGFDANFVIDDDVYADGGLWTSNFSFGNPADMTFTVSGNAALPVEWIAFSAQQQNGHCLLRWSTAGEQNTKDFIIQRSSDGNRWDTIGTVAARGNSNSVVNYSYTDITPAPGTSYYRILQTDRDGRASFSETRMFTFTVGRPLFSVLINPVTRGELKLRINEAAVLSLYNTAGKLLWRKQTGAGVQHIDVSHYPPGIYLLQAKGTTARLLIQ
jgi:hypothetical protein